MSRHTQHTFDYEIAYGRDNIFGLFLQIFDRMNIDFDNDPIVDLDEARHGLTWRRMVEVAEDYGFEIGNPEIDIFKID